jgi:hypothetical protein
MPTSDNTVFNNLNSLMAACESIVPNNSSVFIGTVSPIQTMVSPEESTYPRSVANNQDWWIDAAGACENNFYRKGGERDLGLFSRLELQMMNEEFNIETIAVVLRYYAAQLAGNTDAENLTMEQWKGVVGRYNAIDANAQGKYSAYVYDYMEPLRTIIATR